MNKIFVQNEESKEIAQLNGLANVLVAGDVRIDRVLEIKAAPPQLPELTTFLDKKYCVVFGSVYKSDEPVIDFFIENIGDDCKIILVSHEVDKDMIDYLKKKYVDSVLYSELINYKNQPILIVNNIGKLNSLYQFANLAYIGGGYGGGIHNTLEPAVFNIPVFFGPRFYKFPEAKSLVGESLAFFDSSPINLAKSMINKLTKNEDEKFTEKSIHWFGKHSGATALVFRYLKEII